MNIYFFDVASWEKDYIKNNFKDLNPKILTESLNYENIDKFQDAEIISIFIQTKIDKKIIEKLPKLKIIATRTTGCDHIDIDELKKKNIKLSNVPHYGENTVAEYTFGLILTISRKIFKAYENMKKFNFSNEGLTGFDLKNKILGVIGVGNIGKNVIKIAKGFDMQVIAYDKNINQDLSKKFEFSYVDSLESLLKNSDIITLHLPCNKYTYHIININTIKLIKPGTILINTSRGGLIETEALIYALENNIISGLGLDVLEEEEMLEEEEKIFAKEFENKQLKTFIANHYLINNNKVIVTPHNAFNTKEAIYRILETTEKNIRSFLNDNPINIVI